MWKKVLIGGGILLAGGLFIKFILPQLANINKSINTESDVDLSGIDFGQGVKNVEIDKEYVKDMSSWGLEGWIKKEEKKGNKIDRTFGGLPPDFKFGWNI